MKKNLLIAAILTVMIFVAASLSVGQVIDFPISINESENGSRVTGQILDATGGCLDPPLVNGAVVEAAFGVRNKTASIGHVNKFVVEALQRVVVGNSELGDIITLQPIDSDESPYVHDLNFWSSDPSLSIGWTEHRALQFVRAYWVQWPDFPLGNPTIIDDTVRFFTVTCDEVQEVDEDDLPFEVAEPVAGPGLSD